MFSGFSNIYSEYKKVKLCRLTNLFKYLFKKIYGLKIKKTCIDYCLINMSKTTNKFFGDDQFNETNIIENKNEIKQLANATLNKFWKKIIMLNII